MSKKYIKAEIQPRDGSVYEVTIVVDGVSDVTEQIHKWMKDNLKEPGATIVLARGMDKKDELRVEMSKGALVAYASCNPEYPGIYIDLCRCDGDFPLVLTEGTKTEGDLEDGTEHIITRIWRDVSESEYSERVIHEKV